MLSQTVCAKCSGKVLERNGLDGDETICINCGFGQKELIIPTEALARESKDYQIRNRGGRIYTHV